MSQTVYIPDEFEQFEWLKTDDLVKLSNEVDEACFEMDKLEMGTEEHKQARLRSVAIKKEIAEIALSRMLDKECNTSDETLKTGIASAVAEYFCNVDKHDAETKDLGL
jgi:hypothetical protein